MTGTLILAVGGATSSALALVGGLITPRAPRLGPRLVGCSGGVMLLCNVLALVAGLDPAASP